MGGIVDISCQHLQVMMTHLLQKHLGVAREQKINDEAGQCDTTHNVFGKHGDQDAFVVARPKHIVRIMEDHNVHGWIIVALLREMAGLEGQATFESVESEFSFARCIRQGSVENCHADPG